MCESVINFHIIFKSHSRYCCRHGSRTAQAILGRASLAASIIILLLFGLNTSTNAFSLETPQPSTAECFNYDDGDRYQEENSCQCVVFQGPNAGSFRHEFQPVQIHSQSQKRFSMMSNYSNNRNNNNRFNGGVNGDFAMMPEIQQQRCIFYLFLSDLGDRVEVKLDNVPHWLKLVHVADGAEARDTSSYCTGPGRRPITSASQGSIFGIRIFTELVRPEVNAFDTFQYVLCEKDGPDRRQSEPFVFRSEDRIVAIQILQIPTSPSDYNYRPSYAPKLTEIRGKFEYSANPAGALMPTSRRPQSRSSTAMVPIDNGRTMPRTVSMPLPSPISVTRLTSAFSTTTHNQIIRSTPAVTSTVPVPTITINMVSRMTSSFVPRRRSTTTPMPRIRPISSTSTTTTTTSTTTSTTDEWTEPPPSASQLDANSDQDESVWFVPDCDRNVTFITGTTPSDNSVGVISSPGYPENYPMPGTVCKYTFSAAGSQAAKMRVQITFVDFDLKLSSSSERDMYPQKQQALLCDQVDHIRISFPAAPSNPLKFCGKTRPYAVMSPTPSLDLFFITEPAANPGMTASLPADPPARGYHFQYRFIREEREGTEGDVNNNNETQPPSSESDTNTAKDNSGCEFKFRSWQGTNGSFSSVNHPGFYPRNVKCAYHFIGRVNERVMLVFGFFDVRSSSPDCSDGDYIQIEYPLSSRANDAGTASGRQKLLLVGSDGAQVGDNSNSYQRYARYCSTRRPHGSIFSNWPHLLLTFHTDGRDDGRGFDAYYQFVAADEAAVHQQAAAGAQRLQSLGTTISHDHFASLLVLFSLILNNNFHHLLCL